MKKNKFDELNVGDEIVSKNNGWTFGGNVPNNFDTHADNSIPLYKSGHDLILKLSDYFIISESICYDIGCSTGNLSQRLYRRHKDKGAKIIGVDIESSMIEYAEKNTDNDINLNFIIDDVSEMELQKCDMVVCYYTLQFINPRIRQNVINKIYNALNWGGALLLFEKVRGADARFQDIYTGLYIDFKLEKGFTEKEIISKMKSLKGILEPFSTQGNYDLLKRAGFKDINTFMKYICFEGILAIK